MFDQYMHIITKDKINHVAIDKNTRLHFIPANQNIVTPGEPRLILSNKKHWPMSLEDDKLLEALKTKLTTEERHAHHFKLQPFIEIQHQIFGRLFCTVIEWQETPKEVYVQDALLTLQKKRNQYQ
ncbi:MAG: hypothetical protein KC421_17725 [Anaerolineales bacterium]|nr:hypothetical protein [Anaerolineales bacterium]